MTAFIIPPATAMWVGLDFTSASNGAVFFAQSTVSGVGPAFDAASFYYDPVVNGLSLNTNSDYTGTDSLNTYYQQDAFVINSAQGSINSAAIASHTVSSCKGTPAVPTMSSPGDIAGIFAGWLYTQATGISAYTNMAGIAISASGASSISPGGTLTFYTKANASVSYTSRWTIDETGSLLPQNGSTLGNGVATSPNCYIGKLYRPGTISASSGNQVINGTAGSFKIAAGQSSATITNSYCTANTLVFVQIMTSDSTAKSAIAIPTGGSFTVYTNGNANGTITVAFFLVEVSAS